MSSHPSGTTLLDVSMRDKVLRMCSVINYETKERDEFTREDPIPEKLMSLLDEYTGDGKGRVTVGGEVSSNVEFGYKASAFVSMSVTCDNSLEAMEAVHDLTRPVVNRLIMADHQKVSDLRDTLVPPNKSGLAELHGSSPAQAPQKAKALASKPKVTVLKKRPLLKRGNK